jgi:hypothetical protein
MKQIGNSSTLLPVAFLTVAALLLVGCGGGGGSTATTQAAISGSAVKGPVGTATVTAYAVSGGVMGAQISTATTDAQGNFTLPMGSYTGPMMLQMSGGTYTDEATGATMAMTPGDVMTAVIPTVPAGATISGIQVTPLTSMAQAMAQHLAGGLTDTNISVANTAAGNYFSVSDILHIPPMNPLASGSGTTATQAMMNYGMALAAMSQYAKDQGMASSSPLVTAMMNDASDGIMDGKTAGNSLMMGGMGGGAAMPATAGTSGLAGAMGRFMASAQNRSGVAATQLQALMNQLTGSSGQMAGGAGTGGTPTTGGMVSGSVFDGTVSNATVMAYAVSNGAAGAQLASGATDAQGNFTMTLGNYAGPMLLKATAGKYTDLATGTTMTMAAGDVMTAVTSVPAAGATLTGIRITPLTAMAQTRAQAMSGGMTDANIAASNTAVGNYFMVGDILHTPPMNPLVAGSGGSAATQDMRNYGLALAAMSQFAKDAGMPISSAFITDMMQDASDGVMNGLMGSGQIAMGGMMGAGGMMQSNAGTSGLAAAMTAFMNSSVNMSGVAAADMNALIQKLNSSSGQF